MAVIWNVEFSSAGPFGEQATSAYADLAEDISRELGLVWKMWTENPEEGLAGGVYLFADRSSAERFADKHTHRLESFGITGITGRFWDVNDELSRAATPGGDAPLG